MEYHINIIGKKVRELRKIRGITQSKLAKGIKLSRASVTNIERGKHTPSLERLIIISNFFQTTLDYLLADK